MDYLQSQSCPKTSTNHEQKNHSSKEKDGKTCFVSEMSKYEKWLTELSGIGDKHDLIAKDGVVNMNQENRQYRFIESEQKISQPTENITNISIIDYSNENTSNNSTFDALFTHMPQGNLHDIWHSSNIQSAPQHVPDDKEKEIGNYSTTSRTSKSETDDTESDIIKSDFCRFIEMISSSLHELNDVQISTSIASNSSEEYRSATNLSNRHTLFDNGSCMPESFENSENGIFSYHTNFPTSTGKSGNCEILSGPRDDNLQGIIRNDEERQNQLLRATQTSNDRKRKLCNSGEFLVPANNINVTSVVQGKLDDKRFICKECGHGFRQKINLISHYRTHTGEKPFSCDKCVKKFSQSGSLARHRRIHTGEKPFACDKCEKRYTQRNHLLMHLQSHKVNKK